MLKHTILSLCVLAGGLSTNSAIAQTEQDETKQLLSQQNERFRPIELSVEIFKPIAASFLSRDLNLQAGVAYRLGELHRIRLELGYAECFKDVMSLNITRSARGSFARIYYTWDLYKIVRIFTGLQGGAYQEKFYAQMIGLNFENYNTQDSFKDRYGGMLVGISLQEDMNDWFGLRIYGQTGLYSFTGGERVSADGFYRNRVPGNGAPLFIGYDLYLTMSVGAELLFYF